MGKHKRNRKHRAEEEHVESNNMMDMLSNVDVNQLTSMLSGLNINKEALGNMFNNMNKDSVENNIPDSSNKADGDKTLTLLNSLRPMMPPDKVHLIEKFIYIYNIQKILNNK